MNLMLVSNRVYSVVLLMVFLTSAFEYQLRCCNCGHISNPYESLIDLSLAIEDVDTLPCVKPFSHYKIILRKLAQTSTVIKKKMQISMRRTRKKRENESGFM